MVRSISPDIKKKYAVLVAITRSNKPTVSDIAIQCDMSISSVKRHISDLRKSYGMTIDYINLSSHTGYYILLDDGWVDKDKMFTYLAYKLKTNS